MRHVTYEYITSHTEQAQSAQPQHQDVGLLQSQLAQVMQQQHSNVQRSALGGPNSQLQQQVREKERERERVFVSESESESECVCVSVRERWSSKYHELNVYHSALGGPNSQLQQQV